MKQTPIFEESDQPDFQISTLVINFINLTQLFVTPFEGEDMLLIDEEEKLETPFYDSLLNSTNYFDSVEDCSQRKKAQDDHSSHSDSSEQIPSINQQRPQPQSQPSDEDEDEDETWKIDKSAQKNALQFFAVLISKFFKKNKKFPVSKEEWNKIKLQNNIPSFNKLFQMQGTIRLGLQTLFEGKNLWTLILKSRCRSYKKKMAYKRIGNILRRSFIQGQITGLALSPEN